jgi:hypothetical protein
MVSGNGGTIRFQLQMFVETGMGVFKPESLRDQVKRVF